MHLTPCQALTVCTSQEICVCVASCLCVLKTAGTAPKTATYTLASLLMLCMGDNRNAAVVARAGAIPALVSIAREGSSRAANRELASALLAVMCRSQAAQVDVVASGGIPALTRCVCVDRQGSQWKQLASQGAPGPRQACRDRRSIPHPSARVCVV